MKLSFRATLLTLFIALSLLLTDRMTVVLQAVAGQVATAFGQNASSSTTVSVTISTTAGHGIVVTLITTNSCTSDGTITQANNGADTLTAHVTLDDTTAGCNKQYSNDNIAGGSPTYTFNWTNASVASVYATEISGQATSNAFDKSASTTGTTSTTHASGTTATLSQADEIAIAVFNLDGSGNSNTCSVDSGYSTPANGNQCGAGITGARGYTAYLVTSATTAQSVTLTSANAIANGLIGTYKASTTSSTPKMLLLGVGDK